MQTSGIHSSLLAETPSMNSGQHPETRQAQGQQTGDHIDLHASGDTFGDMDASQISWDTSVMDTTLDMIRSASPGDIHGHLDPARVASLLGDAGMITV
jgi:hypothetical protein